jgi:hypothetical protein
LCTEGNKKLVFLPKKTFVFPQNENEKIRRFTGNIKKTISCKAHLLLQSGRRRTLCQSRLCPLPPALIAEVAEVALHQDVVEADDEAHQHEHLDHLNRGRRLQAGRHAQVPGTCFDIDKCRVVPPGFTLQYKVSLAYVGIIARETLSFSALLVKSVESLDDTYMEG